MLRRSALFLAFAGGCDAFTTGTHSPLPPPRPSASAEAPPERSLEALAPDFAEDILSTDLALDLADRTGKARIAFNAPPSGIASFEIGDLDIVSVTDGHARVPFALSRGRLDVDVRHEPAGSHQIEVLYAFRGHENFDGWEPKEELTFLWPRSCGNLFPCKSDPRDGLRFSMEVTGVPKGETAIYPTHIESDAPSYMPAIIVGSLERIDLGKTSAGTHLSVWYHPGEEAEAKKGTKHLVGAFDLYEKTYGKYSFGSDVGSVSANWPKGAFGGMEHHPYWHVGCDSFGDEYTHAHEAAHGWFGDGVRIACWQDFVLSEGTTSYIAARALEKLGVDAWHTFSCDLKVDCTTEKNTIALPPSCDPIDLLKDPLWSDVPYMKGAFFYRAVAAVIGAEKLDAALAAFYQSHVGKAARMRELIASIEAGVSPNDAAAIERLATDWLETKQCPVDPSTLCR